MISIEELQIRKKALEDNINSITNKDGYIAVQWKIDMITNYLENPDINIEDKIKYAKSDKERLFYKWIKGIAH